MDISICLQLRKLHRELLDYAPPALTSHYLAARPSTPPSPSDMQPWWSSNTAGTPADAIDLKALVRVRTHAEDLTDLTTPKVRK